MSRIAEAVCVVHAFEKRTRRTRLFGGSQPRVSDLVRGKVDRCSIDTLVAMLGHAGVRVDVTARPGRLA